MNTDEWDQLLTGPGEEPYNPSDEWDELMASPVHNQDGDDESDEATEQAWWESLGQESGMHDGNDEDPTPEPELKRIRPTRSPGVARGSRGSYTQGDMQRWVDELQAVTDVDDPEALEEAYSRLEEIRSRIESKSGESMEEMGPVYYAYSQAKELLENMQQGNDLVEAGGPDYTT